MNTHERPTPETDNEELHAPYLVRELPFCVVRIDFARRLERERDEARAELAKMREAIKEAHAALLAHNHTNGCCCDACHAMNGAHPRHDDLCVNTQSALAKLQPFIK